MTDADINPSDNREVTPHVYDDRVFNPYPSSAVQAGALDAQLAQYRRAYANLVAACRAGLLAQSDGETAPHGHPLHPHGRDQDHDQGRDHGRGHGGVGGGW